MPAQLSGTTLPHAPASFSKATTVNASVYVLSTSQGLLQYQAGERNPIFIRRVTAGLSSPAAIATDAYGDVFVYNHGTNNVVEYPYRSGTPIDVLNPTESGLTGPLAIGPNKTFYLGGDDPSDGLTPIVYEHAGGSNAPTLQWEDSSPDGLSRFAVDKHDNFYFGVAGGSCCPPLTSQFPVNSFVANWTVRYSFGAETLNANDDLLVTSRTGSHIHIYNHAGTLIGSIANPAAAYTIAMSLDEQHNFLYELNYSAGNGTVSIINWSTKKVVGMIPNVSDAIDIAVSPNYY